MNRPDNYRGGVRGTPRQLTLAGLPTQLAAGVLSPDALPCLSDVKYFIILIVAAVGACVSGVLIFSFSVGEKNLKFFSGWKLASSFAAIKNFYSAENKLQMCL